MYTKILIGKKELKKKKKIKLNKPFIIICIVLIVIGLLLVIKIIGKESSNVSKNNVEIKMPTPSPDPLRPKNILLMGYGGGVHEGGSLTDTMMVASIIPREKRIVMISVPRDLWIPLPIKGEIIENHKINEAYAIGKNDKQYIEKLDRYKGAEGGGAMAKYAAGFVTGLKIDNYAALNFKGFIRAIDILGGVDVDIPYSFDDEFYPVEGKEDDKCERSDEEVKSMTATMSGDLLYKQFPCRFEYLQFQKGRKNLNGETALKFVRSRHSYVNGSDFGRSIRQQAILKAIKDKIMSPNLIVTFLSLFNNLSKNIETDIKIEVINEMFKINADLLNYKIETIVLNDANVLKQTSNEKGTYILLPKGEEDNWTQINQYINSQIYPPPTPASSK
jgi:polyisoprenyl-teichoic acid--peptidoglycan teichoic acid transferase